MFRLPSGFAIACLVVSLACHTVYAQEKPRIKADQLILPGEVFEVGGKQAFVLLPEESKRKSPQPWIMYAPTLLPQYPDTHEKWMHEQFLSAGIAIAGVDIGEAYGSPTKSAAIDALYAELVSKRGFKPKPCLLGRSRGGLWASSWAIRNPDKVAGLAGIYPVYDLTTYPGLEKAAPAYDLPLAEFEKQLDKFNPIRSIRKLAEAEIPVCIIHGSVDKVVPLEPNSGTLQKTYSDAGKASLVQLIVVPDQGHNHWEGFFRCQELVDFAIAKAKLP